MEQILFSPIGSTDPIRGCHDGPLMHIVRHYQPQIVYLFLSAEMGAHDRLDDRYAKSILAIKPDCQIEKLYTEIIDPHRFDRFIGVFSKCLDKIATKHSQGQILLNLTSGTPQMQLALSLEAVLNPKLVAIQVDSPAKAANIKDNPETAPFEFSLLLELNKDHQETTPNRCREIPLTILLKHNVVQKLTVLINSYQYDRALEFYKEYHTILPAEVGILLKHAVERVNLDLGGAKKTLANETLTFEPFPVKAATSQQLTEFFMVISIRHRCGQLPDFLMKLTPFLYRLTKYYVETCLRFPLSSYTTIHRRGQNSSLKLDSDKLANNPPLKQLFDNQFSGSFRTADLSFTNLLPILEYLAQTNQTAASILPRLLQLRAYEEELRNVAAHEIVKIDEETFAKTSKQLLNNPKTSVSCAMTSKQLLAELEAVMRQMLDREVASYSFIYTNINSEIITLLNRGD